MSPLQLKTLQRLSCLFEEGNASPLQLKELRDLLMEINQRHESLEHQSLNIFTELAQPV